MYEESIRISGHSLSVRFKNDTLRERGPQGLHEARNSIRWTLKGDPPDAQQIILLIRSAPKCPDEDSGLRTEITYCNFVPSITLRGDQFTRVTRTFPLATPLTTRQDLNPQAAVRNSLGKVDIEEIGVQPRLDKASKNSDDVYRVFCVPPINK